MSPRFPACLALLVLVVITVGADDNPESLFRCPDGTFIQTMSSDYDAKSADRSWQFTCSEVIGNPSEQTCKDWSGWSNKGQGLQNFACNGKYAIRGVKSKYDKDNKDRRYAFECCTIKKHKTKNCNWPDEWVNEAWENIDFSIEAGKVISGMYSVYDSGHTDRLFMMNVCDLKG